MIRKPFLKSTVIASIFLLLGAGIASADYTADYVTASEGKKIIEGKVFIKGNLIRQEILNKEEGKVIMIFRPDKNKVWMVNPTEKKYMVFPIDEKKGQLEKWNEKREKKAKYLGKEKVSGLKCKKYVVTDKGRKSYFWISPKFPFPVKFENEAVSTQYNNIKTKRLSKSVFEAPSGYQKMTMPSFPGMRQKSMTPTQGEKQKVTGEEGEDKAAMPKASDMLKDINESVNKSVNKLMDMFKKK
jgi:outer membrane lipoprotein-sorting protein